jgi:hypothetical protein
LLQRLGAIESGAECARWLPLLSALADGEASARELADLRPHLRACPSCRATLRDCHAAPAQVALLVPPAVVQMATGTPHGTLVGHAEVVLHTLAERTTLLAARVQGAFEALPATKVAAVAVSTAALAGGGVALEHASHARPLPHVAASAPDVAEDGRLITIAFPSAAAAGSVSSGRPRIRGGSHSEFGREPSTPPEFKPRTAPQTEFASSPPASASTAAAPVRVANAPSSQSEFGGP